MSKKKTYPHEMFDHSACPSDGCADHDFTVDQYDCVGCHDRAHAQYAQDVDEVVEGSVVRDVDVFNVKHVGTRDDGTRVFEQMREIPVDADFHGPTRFLLQWHDRNGYCPANA